MRRPALVMTIALLGACTSAQAPNTPTSAAPVALPAVGPPYEVQMDPASFSTTIDNPYFPLIPGSRWEYEGRSGGSTELNIVVVTDRTREVMGVETVVVKDTVWVDGALEELTFDWYAQDSDGTVWYFGEISKTYEDGEVTSTEGSWESGVDGALPGVVMPASPQVGQTYRQEYYAGQAEDMGLILEVGATAETTNRTFEDAVLTEDSSLIDPKLLENKYYAPGIGFVLETIPDKPNAFVELTAFSPG